MSSRIYGLHAVICDLWSNLDQNGCIPILYQLDPGFKAWGKLIATQEFKEEELIILASQALLDDDSPQ